MSNNASNYLESGVYNHLLRNSTFSKPSNICLGLTTNNPQDNEGSYSELANTGSYARVPNCSGNALWSEYVDGSPGYNLQEITFPTATADWGYASGIIILDSATYGAGNVLLMGALTSPREIRSGDRFFIPVSGISVQMF